ncbi:peroxidase family protein [Rhizobium herbae]
MTAYHGGGFVIVADGPNLLKDKFIVYDPDGIVSDEVAWFNVQDGSINFRAEKVPADLDAASNVTARSIKKVPYERYFGTISTKDKPKPHVLNDFGEALRFNTSYDDDESTTPVAYTYFGQFVFHDLTAMVFPSGGRKPYSERTASLDLDSVFGPADPSRVEPATMMPVGSTAQPEQSRPCDLPRAPDGVADVKDLRSDDNLPLAQTHLAVIRFFNAIVAKCPGISHAHARSLAVSHFQSVVLHDYLPRVIDCDVYRDVMTKGRATIHNEDHKRARANEPFRYMIPLEFAAACARFGHSMIRNNYPNWNTTNSARLSSFWSNTQNSCIPPFDGHDERRTRLPDRWVSQWGKLLDGRGLSPGEKPLMAAKIDTVLADPLRVIPDVALPNLSKSLKILTKNLASISLLRGASLQLSSAETVAQTILPQLAARASPTFPVLGEELCQDEPVEVQNFLKRDFLGNTPLWFYTLKEAAILGGGQHLGPLGSRIVMETIHAAIEESSPSILAGKWVPEPKLAPSDAHRYTLADLIAFAGLFNP